MVFPDVPAFVESEIASQGGNLVFNPGFERRYGWVYYDGSAAPPVDESPRSGRFCLHVPLEKGGAKSAYYVEIRRGETYLVSAWMKGSAEVNCALFGRDKRWLGRYVRPGGMTGGSEWKRFEGTVVIDDPEACFFNVEFVPRAGDIFVDDVDVRPVP